MVPGLHANSPDILGKAPVGEGGKMCGGIDGLAEGLGKTRNASKAATKQLQQMQRVCLLLQDTNLYIVKFSLVTVGTAESETRDC